MINFIPIFPLEIIVFPGEHLNLHIFEPRYKQLIKECINEKKPFGIPSVFDNRVNEYGTLMEVVELVEEYSNGEMDIRTKGLSIFRVLEIVKELPEKLYSGAIVNYPQNIMDKGDSKMAVNVVNEVKRLYSLLNLENKFPLKENSIVSYAMAHFVGLSLQQEYELVSIFTELQRLEYLRRHLTSITPVVKELEALKARIQMNGHFRDLSLGDFKI